MHLGYIDERALSEPQLDVVIHDRVRHPAVQFGLRHRLPAVRAGAALEGPNEIGRDPAAVEIAGLSVHAFLVQPGSVDASRVERDVVGGWLVSKTLRAFVDSPTTTPATSIRTRRSQGTTAGERG